MDTSKKYSHAGMGGTFDRLHKGHHALINKALSVSNKVTIGLTVNQLSKHKNLHQIIYSYQERQDQLIKYLSDINSLEKVNVTPLENTYGPTITDETIDCLVVTDLTFQGAEKINLKRKELNQKQLPIIKADLIKDNQEKYLSSTRIRQGIVNREGEIYRNFISQEQTINHKQKEVLRKPQGEISTSIEEINQQLANISPTITSLVGDITLSFFLKNNLPFNLGFFDNKTQRKPNYTVNEFIQSSPQHSITNHPGTINPEIITLYNQFSDYPNKVIKVDGEEDLLAVALILLQPLQSVVIYGQPSHGLVIIKVTEEKKEEIKKLLNKSEEK